jgi:hypothetical protein
VRLVTLRRPKDGWSWGLAADEVITSGNSVVRIVRAVTNRPGRTIRMIFRSLSSVQRSPRCTRTARR